MNYRELLVFLQKGDKDFLDVPVKDQEAFMKKLGDPKNDIERSYFQYLCHQYVLPLWKKILYGMGSALFYPIFIAVCLFKKFGTKKGEPVETLMELNDVQEVVPQVVWETYHPDTRFWKKRTSLSLKDLSFIMLLIRRCWHHPYFIIKTVINVAFYSEMIRCHRPSAMIAFAEYSFSSSVLTSFCHTYGVKHIDIQHGEKLRHFRNSYFHFDECYVWHQHYVNLFVSLHAEPTQFRIETPPSLQIDCEKCYKKESYADYKYFLATCTEEQLKSIVSSMQFAKREGKTVKYRPHPRYSDMAMLRRNISENEIEDFSKVHITESVASLSCAVGSHTTVLLQAYCAGKEYLIDDVTFKDSYEKLKERDYILTTLNTKRLSEVQ